MKKSIIALGVVAMATLLLACNKQNPTIEKTPMTISAAIEEPDGGDATKISFDRETNQVTWADGDVVRVFAPLKSDLRPASGNGRLNTFNVTSISLDGKTASFVADEVHDWEDAGQARAIYGAVYGADVFGSYQGVQARTGGGDAYMLTATLGSFQRYSSANNPIKQLLFMTSQTVNISGTDYSPLQDLRFHHKTAIVKIPVKNTGGSITLKDIEITGNKINGEYYGPWVNYTTYTPFIGGDLSSEASSGNRTTLFSISSTLNSTLRYYYIVIWPGTTTAGNFKIKLRDSSDNTKTFTYNGGDFTAEAGHVYKFPVIDWNAKALDSL